MKRLFADTFFFFAYLNTDDAAHREAAKFFDVFDGEVVTTAWVLTELADGLAGTSDRQTFSIFTGLCETILRQRSFHPTPTCSRLRLIFMPGDPTKIGRSPIAPLSW